jgi:hypothetical protein
MTIMDFMTFLVSSIKLLAGKDHSSEIAMKCGRR